MGKSVQYILIAALVILIAVLAVLNPESGKIMIDSILDYTLFMVKILPFIFILIGLFEVWIKREKVEKHLGEEGGITSFLWALILGGTTIGPMLVSLPIAASMYKKGARLSVVFTYLGAATVCRIPMTIFESSYLGVKFTVIRYCVSVPLIIVSSIILGRTLKGGAYEIKEG